MFYFTILFFRELPNGSKFRKFGVGCQGQHTINLFASDTPCCFATSEKDVGSKPILQLHQCDNMQILFVIGYQQKYDQYIYHFLICNKCHHNKMVPKFVGIYKVGLRIFDFIPKKHKHCWIHWCILRACKNIFCQNCLSHIWHTTIINPSEYLLKTENSYKNLLKSLCILLPFENAH